RTYTPSLHDALPILAYEKESSRSFMTGTTPEDWFSIFLIGAPCSRRLVRFSATPPPRLDSCSEELIPRAMDSMLSSTRSRKQERSEEHTSELQSRFD